MIPYKIFFSATRHAYLCHFVNAGQTEGRKLGKHRIAVSGCKGQLGGRGGDRQTAGSTAMKNRFLMRATGERAVRRSVFQRSVTKFRPICVVCVFWLSAIIASPAQTFTTLADFDGTNGATPYYMSLVQGSDGYLYGTTLNGGVDNNNGGTIFKIARDGTGFSTLYSFCSQGGTNCTDGQYPYAGLVQSPTDGYFYGTSYSGGGSSACANGCGTVFKVASDGTGFTTLHSFDGADGQSPTSALMLSPTDGYFYGTTYDGGAHGYGTIFKIARDGTGFSTLYSFTDGMDGGYPFAALVQGQADGYLYGTTQYGGNTACHGGTGCGTVFKIARNGTGFMTLHPFVGTDGSLPVAGLVQSLTDGNFYGTTPNGGLNTAGCGSSGCGTIFKIASDGTGFSTLYSFCSLTDCMDGMEPYAGLVQAMDGNFYGTTNGGGSNGNYGTIFQFIPNGGTLNPLYSFFCLLNDCSDGVAPYGGLMQSPTDRNFYGTTALGGSNNVGTVFSLSLSSSELIVTTSGSGTVTSTDGGINCPPTCTHIYPSNMMVTLNALPSQGSMFGGWTYACSGTGPCTVTMNQNQYVAATFFQPNGTLTVSTSGSGTVVSTDNNINCPGVCGYSYSNNAQVTLHATAAPGWSFTGWGGGVCSGTGPCTVTITGDLSVAASFARNPGFFTLTVSISGAGVVMSTDMPMTINCPGTCSHTYPANTGVTLQATPALGGMFSGWSGGGCTGTGECMVTMNQNQAVTASFSGAGEMMVHSFGILNDGQNPAANLIPGSPGTYYGTAPLGGLFGNGRVFKLSPDGSGGLTETELYDFPSNGINGQNPLAGLTLDAAGNLYGTTVNGGASGRGTVFELMPNGNETVLYSFCNQGGTHCTDGANPYGGLTFDAAGNLYGTTANGGASGCTNGCGTVFELSPNSMGGWTETVLHSFADGADGANPEAGLTLAAGNLYGTTVNGGTNNRGTVFELSPNGMGGWTETVLYSFLAMDGANSYANVIFDTAGNLYGTTANGGANSGGTFFELSPSTGGGWAESFLYSFGMNGPTDGLNPYAGLLLDQSGNLYGTTRNGGLYTEGTIFEMSPYNGANNHCCREILVYSFGQSSADGQHPLAGLIFDSSGNLLGTTANGGPNNGGTVFGIRINPSNFSVLHNFTGGADGSHPFATLNIDVTGNLFGSAANGGTGSCSYLGTTGCGTIFELKKHGSSFLFNPLYSFQGGTDGEFPTRQMTVGPNGTYYGTTVAGGEGSCSFDGSSECGIVFNAGPSSTPQRTPLLKFIEHGIPYRFSGGLDGGEPFTTVTFDSSGNIYGTTMVGGANNLGAVWKLTPNGNSYTESVVYSFAGGNDGANPRDGLVFDTADNLYGTTAAGGGSNVCMGGCGTVFELSPNGNNWTERVIYAFQGPSDGENPNAGVVMDAVGNLYGNTWDGGANGGGTVYELSPNGSNWIFHLLYTVPTSSGYAVGRVTLDSMGNVYETIQGGGAFNAGQVLELARSGSNFNYIDLHDFTGGTDGATPMCGVNFDSNGNLYGTASAGGASNYGVVWEITP